MKRKLFLSLALLAAMWSMRELSVMAAPAEKNAFTPDAIQYGPAPSFVAPGAQLAVLEGNPMASSGDYTIRLKMPDGFRIAPHWHPKSLRRGFSLEFGIDGGIGANLVEPALSPKLD